MVAGATLVSGAFLSSSQSLLQAPPPVLAMLLSSPRRGPGWAPVPWCHPQEVLVQVLMGTLGFLMLQVCMVMLPAQDTALCVGFSRTLVVVSS